MRRESEKRLAAAQLLQTAGDESDSGYLLRLIAFELLLKLVVERWTNLPAYGHHYQDLFKLLPLERQIEVIRIAGDRIGPSVLGLDHFGVLTDLGSNFIKLRYPYEKYGDMTTAEYVEVGAKWIAAGGNTVDADYRYHPEELFGLTFALQQMAASNEC